MGTRFYKKKYSFTLFEILIAITIIAICFTVILSAVGLNIRNTAIAEGYITASLLAKTKMVEIMEKKKFEPGEDNGDFGDSFQGYKWNQEIKILENLQNPVIDIPDLDLSENGGENENGSSSSDDKTKNKKYLFEITLIISFEKANQKRELTFKTIVYESEDVNV